MSAQPVLNAEQIKRLFIGSSLDWPSKSSMGEGKRGGTVSRRSSKTSAPDSTLLSSASEMAAGSNFNFGVYNSVKKTDAAHGLGLWCNRQLLAKLVKASEGSLMTFNAQSEIKPLMLDMLKQGSAQNPTTMDDDLWAGNKATSVTTMLTHLRRISGTKAFQLQMQCIFLFLAVYC